MNKTFEEVWDDILDVAKSRTTISTLSRKKENKIVDFSNSHITVESMETLSPRKLLKGAFEHIWDRLTQSKTLTLKELQDEPKVWKQGAIIFAFFDRLDYVDAVQYPLLTLRLKERGV